MFAFKRFVTIVVMVYLLLVALFYLVPSVRATLEGVSDNFSTAANETQFFWLLGLIGAAVLALHLISENLDSALLRRAVTQHENKINELKAKLYDHQQQAARPVATSGPPVVVTTASPAPPLPDAGSTRPTFPQSDPSLTNTPPAERPSL